MSHSPALLKIGDFARLADTNLRTLRYYEELGLMLPASRSEGGFRYYRHTDVNRLNTIRNLQELGLNLDRIRGLLGTRQRDGERAKYLAGVRDALSTQDRLLEQRIAELQARRTRLREALKKLSECATCARQPGADNNYCEPCGTTGQPLPEEVSALY